MAKKNLSKIKFLFAFLFIFLPSFFVFAQTEKDPPPNASAVVINEICWMGSSVSSSDEWIELYNNSDKEINLSNWKLTSKDNSPEIFLSGIIPPKGFFLLERTDDNSAPLVPADQIFKGALGNGGEDFILKNEVGSIVDEVNCASGWFNGDNASKKTMEKISPELVGNNLENWQTSRDINGTPKSENSKINSPITKTEDIRPQEELLIALNEIMASPQGNDAENEWIELYNPNSTTVDLGGWKIKDKEGQSVTYLIPNNTKILANGYLVFRRKDTKIILNNDKDEVSLINPSNKIIDSIIYEKTVRGESYCKDLNDWVWSGSPTPGEKNVISLSNKDPLKGQTENNKDSEDNAIQTEKNSKNSQDIIGNLGDITSAINAPLKNKINLYSIAALLAIASGLAILFIKKLLN